MRFKYQSVWFVLILYRYTTFHKSKGLVPSYMFSLAKFDISSSKEMDLLFRHFFLHTPQARSYCLSFVISVLLTPYFVILFYSLLKAYRELSFCLIHVILWSKVVSIAIILHHFIFILNYIWSLKSFISSSIKKRCVQQYSIHFVIEYPIIAIHEVNR